MNQLLVGDCRDILPTYPDNYFDSCVIDTPFELGFMGRAWDKTGIAYDVPTWQQVLRVLKPGAHLLAFSSARTYHRMAVAIEDAGFEIRDQVMWVYGTGMNKVGYLKNADGSHVCEGWGGSLKPAHEPICVARKPLEKGLTLAGNVQKWGTGALNIDACRVGPRWPANLLHDGSEQVEALFPESTSSQPSATAAYGAYVQKKDNAIYGKGLCSSTPNRAPIGDTGSAARFFYCPKASKAERGPGNDHNCVKPQALLRYLARLVTPPGGCILDHFTGSGSGPLAFAAEGFSYVAMDLDQHNVDIATQRLEAASYSLAL